MLSRSYSERLGVKKGFQFFVPDTEFGGIIEDVQSNTSYDDITYGGYTWRGYLDQLVIQPPAGSAYLTVSGDANSILRKLLSTGTGLLFTVPEEPSGIVISNFKFRYDTALSGITKMLSGRNARLDIKATEEAEGERFKVMIQAVRMVTII